MGLTPNKQLLRLNRVYYNSDCLMYDYTETATFILLFLPQVALVYLSVCLSVSVCFSLSLTPLYTPLYLSPFPFPLLQNNILYVLWLSYFYLYSIILIPQVGPFIISPTVRPAPDSLFLCPHVYVYILDLILCPHFKMTWEREAPSHLPFVTLALCLPSILCLTYIIDWLPLASHTPFPPPPGGPACCTWLIDSTSE